MPTYPPISPGLTREDALNMILASIAMEELGISHIINAEGEKIQFILKNLSKNHSCDDSIHDVLEVNKSVESLMDVLMQNQVLLKGKMESVLDIMTSNIGPTGATAPVVYGKLQ